MQGDPSGPSGIVNQLEINFEEIEPLSLEQRLIDWLDKNGDSIEDVTTATAALFIADAQSRRDRAARRLAIDAIQEPYETSWGWLLVGGEEVIYLYHEACEAYVHQLPLSALMCCHAACERALAAYFHTGNVEADKKYRMWGLGKLTPEAYKKGAINDYMRERLELVSELRRVSAHFRPALTNNGPEERALRTRAIRFADANPDLSDEEALEVVAMSDALLAIKATTELLRAEGGFGSVSLQHKRGW